MFVPDLYEEVEHDKSATIQAASVVVLSSLAAGVGAIHLGASNFLLGPALSLITVSYTHLRAHETARTVLNKLVYLGIFYFCHRNKVISRKSNKK